jgi:two-component system cell cycle sensor histidine kinase/response regulator CckA
VVLRRFGYNVLEASDGEGALEIYREKKGEISLVILDLIMPGVGGQKCLEKILKTDPSQKVVVASGYSTDGLTRGVLQTGAKSYIEKPFQVGKLLTVVREVLDRE